MVTSFVALTSLSEGYGLVSVLTSKTPMVNPGVILRDSTWTETTPSFILFSDQETDWLNRQPGVEAVSPKIENIPQLSQLDNIKGAPINTIVGINSAAESKILPLDTMIVEGTLPSSGGVALSRILVHTLNLKIGDTVKIKTQTLKLEGVFDDVKIELLSDLDGSRYLPDRLVDLTQPGGPPLTDRVLSKGVETAIIDIASAKIMPPLVTTRIAVKVATNTQDSFAEKIALLRGYQTWSASEFGIIYKSLGSFLEGKGLPLIIPWAIVVLNVIVTMLNSLYERRREISILSSVGLNPAEITSIFVAESSITGFIAGGLGYLAGISFYSLMPLIGITLEVHQKVSAIWSLAAIGIAISAVLAGAFAALRSSIVITPSLQRKWKIEEGNGIGSLWRVPIPMRLEFEEVDRFTSYLSERLRELEDGQVRRTANIKIEKNEDASTVSFIYKSPQPSTGNFYTKNTVIIEPKDGGYSLRLESVSSQEWVHEAGSLVRLITMEWSNRPR
jgi:ABC-type lipoprotein release transport system permease subunit